MNIRFNFFSFFIFICAFHLSLNAQNDLSKAEDFVATGQYKEALSLIKTLPETELRNQLNIEVLVKTGEIDQAKELIRAIKNPNQRKLQNALISQYMGSYDIALDSLNAMNTKAIIDSNFKYNHIKALGINYWLNGDFTEAESFLLKHYFKYPKSAASCNNLGLVYLNNDAQKAEEYFRKGLALSTAYSDNTLLNISLKNNIALALKQQGKNDEALHLFLESEKLFKSPEELPTIQAFVKANISQIYYDKKNINQAIFNCNNAINVLQGYYMSLNKLSKVEEYLIKSYTFNSNTDVIQSPNELYRTLSGKKDKKLAVETMLLQAEYFESLYYRKNPKLNYLEKALDLYLNADSILTVIRRNTKLESDKLAMAKLATNITDNSIRTCLKLREFSFKKDYYFQLAFQFSENSKSRILLEAINESKIKSFAGIPDSVLFYEANIKAQITFYEANKLQISNADFVLEGLYSQNNSLMKHLAITYPQYFELKYGANNVSVKQLQSRLSQNETVLNYYVSDKDFLVVFMITKSKAQIYQETVDQQLERKIVGLRNSIAFNEPKLFAKCVNYLNDKLMFFPLPKNQQLLIVPDPKLSILPFEVLVKKDLKKHNDSYFGPNYLIKEHAISYQYSITLLIDDLVQTNDYASTSLLCSPVEYENGLSTLKGAEVEVTTVDSILKSHNFQNKVLLRTNATETKLKTELNLAYKYVMVSSHGIVNENFPDKSQVFLKKDLFNDGNLMASEIYKMKINTKLMMLTSCQTGLGKLMKGEGIMGLSRALIYAGSRNMMLSLWNVSDRFSVDITRELMSNMESKGLNLAKSLQLSKINLIKRQESSNPYSWAAYILIGK
jgi:CHAT domain-containing protein